MDQHLGGRSAHLRGLDRNTAISIAIAQDWIACFGLQARQEVRQQPSFPTDAASSQRATFRLPENHARAEQRKECQQNLSSRR